MSHRALRLLALVAVLGLIACESPVSSSASSTTATTPRPASPASSSLPRADEVRVVTDALTRSGMNVDDVFASKFDWLFGDAAPRTGTFSGYVAGQQTWADVHFLDRTVGKIVACSGQPMTSMAGTFSVALDGRLQSLNSGVTGSVSSGMMYFAGNDRYFVMTPDLRLRNSLARDLRLSVPSCREPLDLPVLPWEPDIVDAVNANGGEVERVGGSKFEGFLGDRRQARHFRWEIGTRAGGAEVIRLDPSAFVAMCAAPLASSSTFTGWTLRVDGKVLPGIEGTARVFPLVSPKFFALAFDAESAAVLSSLGFSLPPC
jgi:hypothetical protein